MIKVLFVVPRCTKSGPIQVIENIIDNLDRNKYEVFLITLGPENEERSVLSKFSEKAKYKYVPTGKIKAFLGYTNKLKKCIDDISPDVIHTTGIVPDLIISRLYPQKQVLTIHANYYIDYKSFYGPVLGYVMARIHICSAKKARFAITCSESLSRLYKSIDKIQFKYIRNGVKYNNTISSIPKNEMREKLNLPQDGTIWVYAASFNDRKNQKFLLEVFSELCGKTKDYLLLLGDGPTYSELKKHFSMYSNIIFEGRVVDVNSYLRSSDYFVSSSIQEGMPMGVLEAMSQGMPVLLSDIEQHEEILNINNKVGMLFRNNDIDDFKSKMKQIKGLNEDELRAESRKTIFEEFSAKHMSEEYQKLYVEIKEMN